MFEDAGEAQALIVAVAGGGDHQPDREAIGGQPGGHGDRGQVGHVGEHCEQRSAPGVTALAGDLGGHRALGGERCTRVGRGEQHVHVFEQIGDLQLQSPSSLLDLRELRQRDRAVAAPTADDERIEFVEAVLPVVGHVDELIG